MNKITLETAKEIYKNVFYEWPQIEISEITFIDILDKHGNLELNYNEITENVIRKNIQPITSNYNKIEYRKKIYSDLTNEDIYCLFKTIEELKENQCNDCGDF